MSQDMQDMRDCYDRLLAAAAVTANSAYGKTNIQFHIYIFFYEQKKNGLTLLNAIF